MPDLERVREVQERGYCVLRGHFPKRPVEACREAFWPVLRAYLEAHDGTPNRGPRRHFLPMPFDPPCFAPEFFFDPRVLAIVRGLMDDRMVADQWGCDVPLGGSEYQEAHVDYQRPLFAEAPDLPLTSAAGSAGYTGFMATLAGVPVEEYLSTCYDPDREYVKGQLVERHVGEYDHSRLQLLLAALLASRQHTRRFRCFVEQRVRVSDEPRYRIPDLCVKALPHEKTAVLVQPDLAIEIVSPDDEPVETIEKIGDYQAAGIPYIWVVNPYKRTLIEADANRIRRPASLVLATPLVGEVDFAALFAELDEPSE